MPPTPPKHRVHVWPWLRPAGRLVLRDWLAITLGRHVLAWRRLSERELRHELAHVEQWRRHGLLLVPLYALESWRSRRTAEGWYRGNRFEVEARAAEASAQDEAGA
jgi:hypothetical protein